MVAEHNIVLAVFTRWPEQVLLPVIRNRHGWIGLTATIGTTALGVAYFAHVNRPGVSGPIDFDQYYAAARFVIEGRDPYVLIGPGRAFDWKWPFFYPLPTALAVFPLAFLSQQAARLTFAGIGLFLYLLALNSVGGTRWRYITLISKSAQVAFLSGQFSFLLAAMYVFPRVAAFAAVKPNIAAAIAFRRLDRQWIRWALLGTVVLVTASLVVNPTWPTEWLAAVGQDPFRSPPVLRPLGFVLVAAALKWRRPEARLLLGLSFVPQTIVMYDSLLLFFVPQRSSEFIALTLLSHFSFLMVFYDETIHGSNARIIAAGTSIVHYLYIPCLLMVLLRSNEGIVPDWLERLSYRLPGWLRGRTSAPMPDAAESR